MTSPGAGRVEVRELVVCVFAKPPLPGLAKTRLVPALGEVGAAHLARALFEDLWEQLGRMDGVRPVVATTGPLPEELGIDAADVWPQGGGDLGARIERILRQGLRAGDAAVALGADTAGLPRGVIEETRAALADHDAVLGPADDGGFYLLGVRACPPGLLADLPWSDARTGEATLGRLTSRGLRVHRLRSWFDVDRPDDLDRLHAVLERGEVDAPRTAVALKRSGTSHTTAAAR